MPTITTRGLGSLKAFGFAGRSGAITYDSDALAYFAACTTQPDTTRKGLINTLVVGLKTDGLWTKIDWLLLLASQDHATTKQASRVNLRAPSKVATQDGTLTYSALGIQGNGINGCLEFNERYDASGNVFATNSAFLSTYVNGGTGFSYDMGETAGAGTVVLTSQATGTESQYINTGTALTAATTAKNGSRIGSRTGATAVTFFREGTAIATSSATTSGIIGNGTLFRQSSTYSAGRLALVASGGGLTNTEATAFYNRTFSFLTAIGAT